MLDLSKEPRDENVVNRMIHVERRIADFGAYSLYPSARNRTDGYLTGLPKVLNSLPYGFLQKQDGYFVRIIS